MIMSKKDVVFKVIKIIIISVLVAMVTIAASVWIVGYGMYRNALSSISLQSKIEYIRSDCDYVELGDVSESFVDALVSVEDHRFYKHSGFDIISIGRAVLSNIKNKEIITGGSTITQQLAKNMYFTFEKKFTRKVAELFMALKLERELSKDEILELYFNVIYFGSDYYGIGEASVGYFGVDPDRLSVGQAVILAGIPQAPGNYNLKANPEKIRNRSSQVIKAMIKNNQINKTELNAVYRNIDEILNKKLSA